MKNLYIALAAIVSISGCSTLQINYTKSENGLTIAAPAVKGAEIALQGQGPFKKKITKYDRNGDKKTDLAIIEGIELIPDKRTIRIMHYRNFVDDFNFDGFVDTMHSCLVKTDKEGKEKLFCNQIYKRDMGIEGLVNEMIEMFGPKKLKQKP